MEILEEDSLVKHYLKRFKAKHQPLMIQIGANEGKHEYAKKNGKDFVFEFLRKNRHWEAVLVEPLSDIFKQLKFNYRNHRNTLSFLNCAITEQLEERSLFIAGKEGKRSSLKPMRAEHQDKVIGEELVQCIPYLFMCEILGIDSVDFIKIDTEGYDEIIVRSILLSSRAELLPKIIFWESTDSDGPEKDAFESYVTSMGYSVFVTGLSKSNSYMDRVAISDSF